MGKSQNYNVEGVKQVSEKVHDGSVGSPKTTLRLDDSVGGLIGPRRVVILRVTV